MEVSASPVRQQAPSAQAVGFVHGTSIHVPRWHPVDGGPHCTPRLASSCRSSGRSAVGRAPQRTALLPPPSGPPVPTFNVSTPAFALRYCLNSSSSSRSDSYSSSFFFWNSCCPQCSASSRRASARSSPRQRLPNARPTQSVTTSNTRQKARRTRSAMHQNARWTRSATALGIAVIVSVTRQKNVVVIPNGVQDGRRAGAAGEAARGLWPEHVQSNETLLRAAPPPLARSMAWANTGLGVGVGAGVRGSGFGPQKRPLKIIGMAREFAEKTLRTAD